jgi:diacylglycerol kinase family enzyme
MGLEPLEHAGDQPAADAPPARRRMLVIVNPFATTVSAASERIAVAALQGCYDVQAIRTRGPAHATELARTAAAAGHDLVVAHGGDGTINEVASGLAGSSTALSVLPGGSQNVYAKMLGMPADAAGAARRLMRVADDWRPRPVDLGRVNDRCFVFSSGLGLDAAVVRRVDTNPRAKARMRHWYYAGAGLRIYATDYVRRPPCIDVDLGGQTVRGVTALVQTGDPYTFWGRRPLRVAQDIALDDGTLAGAVLQRAGVTDVPAIIVRLFAQRLRVADHRRVLGFGGVRRLVCTSADGRPIPLQVDGDYVGEVLEARYEVVPGGLWVVA